MAIADVLSKLRKGETLNEEETKILAEFDPQKALDDAAAAARRRAEEKAKEIEAGRAEDQKKLAELQARLDEVDNAGKSDQEKMAAEVERLTNRLTERDATIGDLQGTLAKRERSGKIDQILTGAGIRFVEGVDKGIFTGAFENVFAGLEMKDLDDEHTTKPLIEAFRTTNKAVIVDDSGRGSGAKPHVGGQGTPPTGGQKAPDQQSDQERAETLRSMR